MPDPLSQESSFEQVASKREPPGHVIDNNTSLLYNEIANRITNPIDTMRNASLRTPADKYSNDNVPNDAARPRCEHNESSVDIGSISFQESPEQPPNRVVSSELLSDLEYKDQGLELFAIPLLRQQQQQQQQHGHRGLRTERDYQEHRRDIQDVLSSSPPTAPVSHDLPSGLDYKDQGRNIEDILGDQRHGPPVSSLNASVILDLPSDIEYKDQGREVTDIFQTQTPAGDVELLPEPLRPQQRGVPNDPENGHYSRDVPQDDQRNAQTNKNNKFPDETAPSQLSDEPLASKMFLFRLSGARYALICSFISLGLFVILLVTLATTKKGDTVNDEATSVPTATSPTQSPSTTTSNDSLLFQNTTTVPFPPTIEPSNSTTLQWIEVGTPLNGAIPKMSFGYGFTMSGDGQVLVAGAPTANINGMENRGFASIWRRNGTADALTWIMEASYSGHVENEYYGHSSAVSKLGNMVAIGEYNHGVKGIGDYVGRVSILEYNAMDEKWQQVGEDLLGSSSWERFGVALDFNDDGSVLAVGMEKHKGLDIYKIPGRVRVYQNNRANNTWTPVGQIIDGTNEYGILGNSVSLSSKGKIIAIGSLNEYGPGFVQVYEYESENEIWVNLGQEIVDSHNASEVDLFGFKVSLSSDGQTLAVSSLFGTISDNVNQGFVQVYRFDGHTQQWIKHGNRLVGEPGENFGFSLHLLPDSTAMVVGANRNEKNGYRAGRAQVYQWDADSTLWKPMGESVYGLSEDRFGVQVALTDDASLLAVAAHMSDTLNGDETGSIHFFERAVG